MVTATYHGDNTYKVATATPISLPITGTTRTNTSTPVLTSPASPSLVTSGSSVTVAVTVSPQSGPGTPTGTAAFTATIGTTKTTPCASAAVISGTAQCSFTPGFTGGKGGKVTITAVYSGDGTFQPSTSAAYALTVVATNPATAFTLTLARSPITVGQTAQLTARVTGTLGTPTGTIAVTDNGSPVTCTSGSTTLTSTGTATCNYVPTSGSHALVATYSGNTTYAPITPTTPGYANTRTLVVNP
jgi:hypothetical protein